MKKRRLSFLKAVIVFIYLKLKYLRKNVSIESFLVEKGVVLNGYNIIRYGSKVTSRVIVGMGSYIGGPGSILDNVTIGNYCSIGPNVIIGLGNHDMMTLSTSPLVAEAIGHNSTSSVSRVFIGNDVWIGAGSIILAGVKIGDGAVIGAGAVVTKNVEDNNIVVGIPAKVKGIRTIDPIYKDCLGEDWFNLTPNELREKWQ